MKIYIVLILIILLSCSVHPDKQTSEESNIETKNDNLVDTTNNNQKAKTISNKMSVKNHPVYELFKIDSLSDKKGEIIKVDSTSYKPYKIVHFTFMKGKDKDLGWKWPYGYGWVLIENYNTNAKLIGYDLEYGDFPAHTFNWIDFDGDGDLDLYTFSGEEDVFSSRLFINSTSENTNTGFKIIYNNDLAYCPLIDINHDGFPEILSHDSVVFSDFDPEMELNVTKENISKVNEEYDRIVGKFDKNNFDYNMPEHYKLFSIGLIASIRILKVEEDIIHDVSDKYSDHFCNRSKILNEIEVPGRKIEPRIDNLIQEYNSKYGCEK